MDQTFFNISSLRLYFLFFDIFIYSLKMASKQEMMRNRILNFILNNPKMSKKEIVRHFMVEGMKRSTIYGIIKRHENNLTMKRKEGSGLTPKKFDLKNRMRLIRYFNHSDKVSLSSGAKKFACDKSTIKYWLKKLKIKRFHKKKVPMYKNNQDTMAKRLCAHLYNKYHKKKFILDDEKYFTLTSTINDNFYSSSINTTPNEIKFKEKQKFEPKVMLWIALSERGISKPFVVPSGLAINQIIYQKECIKKRLIPFINAHHSDNNYLFWPDKASSHYAKKTIELLKNEKINFVPKHKNPTNVPQCRPIEDFFGYHSISV